IYSLLVLTTHPPLQVSETRGTNRVLPAHYSMGISQYGRLGRASAGRRLAGCACHAIATEGGDEAFGLELGLRDEPGKVLNHLTDLAAELGIHPEAAHR